MIEFVWFGIGLLILVITMFIGYFLWHLAKKIPEFIDDVAEIELEEERAKSEAIIEKYRKDLEV